MKKLIIPEDILPLGSFHRESQEAGLHAAEEMRFSPTDLSQEYVFFNHGVFFESGFFTDNNDPVGDWYARYPHDVNVIKQAYVTPIFNGFTATTFDGRTTWGNVLCGVEAHAWHSLLEYLAGIAARNWSAKEFAWAYYGWVDVLDPSYVDEKGLFAVIPTIKVCVFCLSTNKRTLDFVRPQVITQRPWLRRAPPRPEMVEIGSAALDDDFDALVHRHNTAHAEFLSAYRRALEHGPIIED